MDNSVLLTLLAALHLLAATNMGSYQIEPWKSWSPSQALLESMLDSVKTGRQLVRYGKAFDSAGKLTQIDTLTLSANSTQWLQEQRLWRINDSSQTQAVYTTWTTLAYGRVDSLYRQWWRGDSLTGWEHLASERVNGFLRSTYDYGPTPASKTRIDTFSIRLDSLDRLVSERVLRKGSTSTTLEYDSVLWNASGSPGIWWSMDSGGSEYRETHHLSWSGTQLVSDTTLTTRKLSGGGYSTDTSVISCTWKGPLLQECRKADMILVQMEWNNLEQPIRRVYPGTRNEEIWSWDSLGRIVEQRQWSSSTSYVSRQNLVYGKLPWPTIYRRLRCDTATGNTCTQSSWLEYSYSFPTTNAYQPRAPRHSIHVNRFGNALVVNGLPSTPTVLRFSDPVGQIRSISSMGAEQVRIRLPMSARILFWDVRSQDGTLLASGTIITP